jgi:hypothetical protein
MELSSFTVMTKDFAHLAVTEFKHILFAKFDDKVYIKVSDYVSISVILPFKELMNHSQLKAIYEMSLCAVGKPNIDPAYYGCEDQNYIPKKYEKNNYMYIDTTYIVKDALSGVYEAKKGNTYHSINLKQLMKMKVSTDTKKEEFYNNYKSRYAFYEENFEDSARVFKTLVSDSQVAV